MSSTDSAAHPPLSDPAWRRFGQRLLLLVLGLVVLGWVWRASLPYPWGDSRLRAKLEYFEQHQEVFDTVFVGSSYTYRHISPRVFDAELEQLSAGRRRHKSFNLAVDGMHLPATEVLLHHLASAERPRLRHVFLELGRFTSAVDRDVDHSTEAQFWRTPALTYSMMRFLWFRPDKSFQSKALQTLKLAGIQAEASLGVGQGPDLVQFLLDTQARGPEAPRPDLQILGPDRDGFYAVDQQAADQTGAPMTNRFLRNPKADQLLDEVRELARAAFEAPLTPANPEGLRRLSRLLALAEAQDWRLVFVVPPRLGTRYVHVRPLFRHIPESQLIWRPADPRVYDSLYRLDESADRGHLSSEGALRYSRLLAREALLLDIESTSAAQR